MRLVRPVVILGLALAAPALAQAQAKAGVDTTPPSTWRLQLNADGSWYENPYFDPTVEGVSGWSTSGYATLTRTRRFRTGNFSLSGFGGVLYYPEIDDFTQPTYGGSFNLDWAASRRTSLTLAQSYSRSNTRALRGFQDQNQPGNLPGDLPESLPAQDVPLPTSDYEYATTSLSFQHQLSERWQFGLGGSFDWRRYADERLTGGEQVTGQAQLGHTLGKTSSIYLAYGYGASWFDEGVTRSHQGLLGVRKQVDKGVSFGLAGGVGYLESTGSFYPAGNASLSASGRRTHFTLSYARDFGQTFGYGRQTISDLAAASFSWTPARKLSLNAGYHFEYRRDALDETYTIQSHVVSAGFGWEIVKNLSFGGSYSWERNETEGQPIVDGGRATASLSYGVDWR